jgi:Ca2+-binding EF-hand superfamily protein
LKNKLSFKSTGKYSDENTLLRAFKFSDLSNSGFCNPENFLRALARLGINIVNRDNVLDYFNLYDYDRTGRINYKDFVTEIFTPLEMRRRKIMEEEKSEPGEPKQIPQKKEKRKYNLTSTGFRQKIEQNLDDNENLIKKIRNEILCLGVNILFDIQKTLNKFDVDNSGRIDIDEFNKLCSEYSINLIPDEIKTVFTCFDPSRTGKIYYQDFLNIIHGSLNDFRQGLVDELYNKLNKNNRANLDMKTVLSSFNDKKAGQEASDEFKDNFISHHDYFSNGKTDVSYNEFVNFFEVVSTNFKEDAEFEKYLNDSFSQQDGEVNKTEESNKNEEQKEDEQKENENKEQAKEVLGSIDKLRQIITQQGAKGVMNLLRNLRNVDLAGSNGVDLDEFITVIQNVLKDSDGSFPVKEIHNIFNIYDIQEKGIMEYKTFLSDLFKLKSMSKSRKNHLEKIFEHLDFERKQALDINELISLYKKPEASDPNPVPDLLETFVIFHNIIRGTRNPLVNLDDFIEYYNYVNFLIPETKNDKLFIDYTSDGWRLNDKTFDERKNLADNKLKTLGKQKNRDAKEKLIGNSKTPYGTIKDKINYNLNEEEATIKYNVNSYEDLMAHLRNNLVQRGPRGLMSIRRTFMLIDENSDKRIQFSEFEKMFKRYRFNLSQTEINNLFNYFDKDGSGYIDYGEFIGGILGDLSKFRKDILKQVFDKLDKDETGTITVGQLREAYNPKEHPLVRQGKRSEDEILGDFIDSLEYHFSLLNEKNDENVDVNDIKIDFDEFCDFYKTISVSVEDDKYFEIMVMSEWGLKKDGRTLYQRTWNQQDA